MAKGHENLIPLNKRSKEAQREIQEKGRQANKKKWAEKMDLRERAKALMELAADPRVATAMSKTGIEIHDNADVVLAGIMKGVLKGETKSINLLIELSGQNGKADTKDIERRKAEAEAERAEMETEFYRMRLNAIKGVGVEEMPDDGFLEALKGTAGEDWSDEVL